MVWRTARRLDAALAGRVLTLADLRWPSLATSDLTGLTVREVVAAGKHLLTRMDADDRRPPLTLHSHLRMDGSWHVHRTGERWRNPRPADGVRAALANEEWTAIGHDLGMLDLVATDDEHTLVGHLGPDVLGATWDANEVRRHLEATPDRHIGEALMDQRVLAGVGTFFMAESLFLRGFTPWTAVRDAGDLDALLDLLQRLLTANAARAVQSTTGDLRPKRTQWVHARAGEPCRRCGTTVRVAPIGVEPRTRPAFWCPRCQR